MSSIDERVVSMKFNNQQFESGVKTTLGSLASLKTGLNLDGATKSIAGLQAEGNRFSLKGMADGIQGISTKFMALATVGITALANLTNKAVDAGLSIAKSLTLDPVMEGFAEYELKMGSIQTILSNTSKHGTTLEQVTASLDELNLYADKTIYNFGDMTKNIGLFTNAGIGIEDATSMIKGFSNEAAASGTSAQGAAGAAYQLSQALSAGVIRLQDWRSLTNVGMGNKNMQNGLIEIADAMGEFQGKSITAQQAAEDFNGSLEKKWMSADVMQNYLKIQAGELSDVQMRNIGLSAEQIKAFKAQAKIAEEAATKVRTWTQFTETLMEGVGSSWTDTFDIIIGNFNEATELWTGVSERLGGIIDGMGAARNNMLLDWKELGGRDLAIDAIKNSFEALLAAFKPLKDAFTEIFPPATGKTLYDITKAIHEFTLGLKMGGETSENLKNTFKGVFSILSIGWEVIKGLASGFGAFFSALTGGTGGLLSFSGSLGEVVTKFADFLKEGDYIVKFFTNIGKAASTVIGPIMEFVSGLGSAFGLLIKGDYAGFFNGLISSVQPLKDLFSKIGEGVTQLGSTFVFAFGYIKAFFTGSKEEVQAFHDAAMAPLKSFGEGVSNVFGKLKEAMGFSKDNSIADFENGMDTMKDAGTRTAESIGEAWDSFKEKLSGIKEFFQPAIDFIGKGVQWLRDKFSDLLENMSFDQAIGIFSSGALMGLIGFITVQIKKLVDSFKGIPDAVGGIGEVFAGITGSLEAMQSSLKAKTLMTIAGAIALLAAAVLVLSFIEPGPMIASLTAITALMGGLMGTMALFSKISATGTAGMTSAAASLVILSVAVLILASAVQKLSDLSWEELAKGLVGVGGLLGALMLFTKFSNTDGASISSGAGLMLLAVAVNIMASAIEKLGALDIPTLAKGFVTITGVLAVMAGFTQITKNAKGFTKTAVGMTILAAAMLVMSHALAALGSMEIETLAVGMGAMAISMGLIAGAMQLMPKDMAVKAVALTIVSAALLVLSQTLQLLAGMSMEELAVSIGAMAVALGVIAGAMYLMTGALPGAAALIIVSAALALFVPVLMALSLISWEQLGMGLAALAAVFLVLGLAGLALAPVIIPLMGLGAAIMLIGAGAALAGAGLLAMATGVTLLAASGAAGIALLGTAISMIAALIPEIATQVGNGIKAFAKVIGESTPEFTAAMTAILMSILGAIKTVGPEVIDTLMTLIMSLVDALATSIPEFATKGIEMLIALLEGIAANIGGVVNAAVDIIVNFVGAIGDNIGKVTQAGIDLIIDFIDSLADSIRTNTERVNTSVRELISAMIDALIDSISNIQDIGMDICKGIAKGITNGVSNVVSAATSMAKDAFNAAKGWLGIQSPSKKFAELGKFVVQGFVKGIKGNSEQVESAFNTMKEKLKDLVDTTKADVKKLQDELKKLNDSRKKNISELTAQQNALKKAQAAFDKNQGKRSKTAKANAKKAQADIKKAQAAIKKLTAERDKDTAAINKANKALKDAQAENKKATAAYTHLTTKLVAEKNALKKLADQYDNVVDKLNDANQALEDAKQTRDDYNKSLEDQYGSLETIQEEETVADYFEALEKRIKDTQHFTTQLQKLRSLGLNDEMYKKLLEQGLDALPFVDELAEGGQLSIDELNSLTTRLDWAASKLGTSASKELYQAGVDAAEGLVKGLQQQEKAIQAQMNKIADAMVKAIKSKLGIKSPSRVFAKVGGESTDGLIKGLKQTSAGVAAAASDVGDEAIDALKKSLEGMNDILEGDMDLNPVIRPVLDLSSVEKDASSISGMLAPNALNVDKSTTRATRLMQNSNRNDGQAGGYSDGTRETGDTYIQNNYSPKALSASEIYRQTKNQLSGIKEGLPK